MGWFVFAVFCTLLTPALASAADTGTSQDVAGSEAAARLPAPEVNQSLKAPDVPLVGEPLELQIWVHHPAGTTVDLGWKLDQATRWQLADRERETTEKESGLRTDFTLTYQVFRAGPAHLPAMEVVVTGPDGRSTASTEPIDLKITSALGDAEQPGFDGPLPGLSVTVPDYTLVWAAGGGAAAVLALLGLLVWWRRRRPDEELEPEGPADERALAVLNELENGRALEAGDTMYVYVRMSAAVRGYLGARYGFPGREWTTAEILERLESVDWPDPLVWADVRGWFSHVDRVKFSGQLPDVERGHRALAMARRMVEATRAGLHASEDGEQQEGERPEAEDEQIDEETTSETQSETKNERDEGAGAEGDESENEPARDAEDEPVESAPGDTGNENRTASDEERSDPDQTAGPKTAIDADEPSDDNADKPQSAEALLLGEEHKKSTGEAPAREKQASPRTKASREETASVQSTEQPTGPTGQTIEHAAPYPAVDLEEDEREEDERDEDERDKDDGASPPEMPDAASADRAPSSIGSDATEPDATPPDRPGDNAETSSTIPGAPAPQLEESSAPKSEPEQAVTETITAPSPAALAEEDGGEDCEDDAATSQTIQTKAAAAAPTDAKRERAQTRERSRWKPPSNDASEENTGDEKDETDQTDAKTSNTPSGGER